MTPLTSAGVIHKLRALFATFGLPQKVMSDNGTAFVSGEIMVFYRRNGIHAVTSALYHTATNGQAERMTSELKTFRERRAGPLIIESDKVSVYKQHATVSTSTGKTPAIRMFGKKLTTNISRLRPSTDDDEERPEGTLSASSVLTEGQWWWSISEELQSVYPARR